MEIIEANWEKFTCREVRDDISLDWVSERLGSGLKIFHSKLGDIDLTEHRWFIYAFQDFVTAFLALNGLVGEADQPKLVERLIALDHEQFKAWLDHVEFEGKTHNEEGES